MSLDSQAKKHRQLTIVMKTENNGQQMTAASCQRRALTTNSQKLKLLKHIKLRHHTSHCNRKLNNIHYNTVYSTCEY